MWQQANNTADGRLSTKETDPASEDTRMYTIISCEEEDALLSEDRGEDVGCNDDSITDPLLTLEDRSARGIQRTS